MTSIIDSIYDNAKIFLRLGNGIIRNNNDNIFPTLTLKKYFGKNGIFKKINLNFEQRELIDNFLSQNVIQCNYWTNNIICDKHGFVVEITDSMNDGPHVNILFHAYLHGLSNDCMITLTKEQILELSEILKILIHNNKKEESIDGSNVKN